MIEFTGERVIPGEVDDDLWAEHLARYAFAARYSSGKLVLDIGSGAGYGVVELAHHGRMVTGIDLAQEAITYSRANYPLANVHFLQASATRLPFGNGCFDLITAFEVIEHLADWSTLLAEARRVLARDGLFLVSTPNKLYYAESRAKCGPNAFHAHEFEFSEFRDALAEVFPHVAILLQNRLESFAFCPHQASFAPLDARLDGTRGSPAEAHFFLAVCASDAAPELRSFLYVPRAANILREREQHIHLLEDELSQTKNWLTSVIADRQELIELHTGQTRELEERNQWALQLEKDWKAAMQRIGQLQDELKGEQAASAQVAADYACKVADLEDDNRQKTEWALATETRLSGELAAKCGELAESVRLLDAAEATVTERTQWAQSLQARLDRLEAQFQMLRESRWLKLGRAAGLGPVLKD